MVSLHTSRTETKTRLGTKVWAVVAVTYLTMLLFVIMWQNFGFWIRKAAGGCKEPLGHLHRSLEVSSAERNVYCRGPGRNNIRAHS